MFLTRLQVDFSPLPAPRSQAAALAEASVGNWLAVHGETVAEPAWRPDVAARRMLNWAAHAPQILSSTDLVYRSAVLNHFARTGRHLVGTADRMPAGAARIIAWCGVVATGLLIPGNDARRLFGEAELAKALNGGLTSDGGALCRAPDAQVELIETLIMLRSAYAVRKLACPDVIGDAITRAAPVLAGITHGDGALSSW